MRERESLLSLHRFIRRSLCFNESGSQVYPGRVLIFLVTFISPPPSPRRSTLHQASTQPCYLLPTLSPGCSPGSHLSRVPSRTRQPAASDRPGHPPAPGTPSAPHCPACAPSVPGCAGASIPTSGLTPAIPHPAAAPRSAAPQDPPALQKNPGEDPPEPSPAAFRLRVLPSPPCPTANDTAAAVPGRRH